LLRMCQAKWQTQYNLRDKTTPVNTTIKTWSQKTLKCPELLKPTPFQKILKDRNNFWSGLL
jgi:hypothetical protein